MMRERRVRHFGADAFDPDLRGSGIRVGKDHQFVRCEIGGIFGCELQAGSRAYARNLRQELDDLLGDSVIPPKRISESDQEYSRIIHGESRASFRRAR